MNHLIDLKGQRFGRWLVLHREPAVSGKKPRWVCQCECPDKTIKIVDGGSLRRGMTTSCGCFQREDMSRRKTIHGAKRIVGGIGSDRRAADLTYASWNAMRTRCLNPRGPGYASHGGRGITICKRWDSFTNFLEDMGPRPADKTLDRINNDGNYNKENCRWATDAQQMINRRGTRRELTDDEIKQILTMLLTEPRSAVAKAFDLKPRAIKSIRDNAVAAGLWTSARKYRNKSLTDADVVEIRRRIKAGETIEAVAKRFSVHVITVRRRLSRDYAEKLS